LSCKFNELKNKIENQLWKKNKMENQQSYKRYIHQCFDKFKNRTDTHWKDPHFGKVFGAKWDLYVWELSLGNGEDRSKSKLSLSLRHVKTPEVDAIVFDYDFTANDWMFLRNGTMIVNLNGVDNIELKPIEAETDVRNGGRCNEVGIYNISKENLKRICDANSIEVRVSGGSSYLELKDKGLLKFQFMCRSFYSDLYDDHSYDNWINSIIPPESEAKSRGNFVKQNKKNLLIGCVLILGLTVLIALIKFFLCNDYLKGDTLQVQIGQTTVTVQSNGPEHLSTSTNDPSIIENRIIIGTYLGMIGKKDFKLFIEKVEGDNIEGYNVTGTNKRPVKGLILKKWNDGDHTTVFKLILTEPGDDKWDGEFNIDLSVTDQGRSGKGNWKSFNGKLEHNITFKTK
jgi:hypothetical protein